MITCPTLIWCGLLISFPGELHEPVVDVPGDRERPTVLPLGGELAIYRLGRPVVVRRMLEEDYTAVLILDERPDTSRPSAARRGQRFKAREHRGHPYR